MIGDIMTNGVISTGGLRDGDKRGLFVVDQEYKKPTNSKA